MSAIMAWSWLISLMLHYKLVTWSKLFWLRFWLVPKFLSVALSRLMLLYCWSCCGALVVSFCDMSWTELLRGSCFSLKLSIILPLESAIRSSISCLSRFCLSYASLSTCLSFSFYWIRSSRISLSGFNAGSIDRTEQSECTNLLYKGNFFFSSSKSHQINNELILLQLRTAQSSQMQPKKKYYPEIIVEQTKARAAAAPLLQATLTSHFPMLSNY